MFTDSLSIDLEPDRMPRRPYCSNNLATGLLIRPLAKALEFKYIQLNRPDWLAWLVFDVDRPGAAFEWSDANLPPPSWSTTSGRGHAHLVYALSVPVYLGETARVGPINLVRAIQYSMSIRLGADPGYTGLITRNPTHSHWLTALHAGVPSYELRDLLEWVEPKAPAVRKPFGAVENVLGSRNVDLFDRLRRIAYSQVLAGRLSGLRQEDWTSLLVSLAESMNHYQPHLAHGEVRAVAKSVAKWTWRRYTGQLSEDQFSALQAARGSKKGDDKRRQGMALLRDGMPVMHVAEALTVGRATVYRWQKKIRQSIASVSIPNQITAEAEQQWRHLDMSSQDAKQPCRASDKSSQAAPSTGGIR
jgi:transposase-like protein